ncbi:HD domain-containing protein, partial [Klebsiella pneumoniae]|uniref:HD-GYP domain-containing protein n=1 Tax=Klebsiella pneumoniae TaxID=573 RepID=UPI00148EF585
LPAHASNHGELYNLSIRRGTLNDEERFKINEHIVQTIIMLSSLPFPRHLKRVPDIAGNHHEKMNGSGYPRRLGEQDLGIAERVMAIADIFEALTAADRPYKPPK